MKFSVTKKDLTIQTFTAGGKGGQHQNKVATGVRITHPESGAMGEARDTRSQHANIKAAFTRLVESQKFRTWHRIKVAEVQSGKSLDAIVDAMMDEKNIRLEVRNEHGWEVVGLSSLVEG